VVTESILKKQKETNGKLSSSSWTARGDGINSEKTKRNKWKIIFIIVDSSW
jgi:hypothetical protein